MELLGQNELPGDIVRFSGYEAEIIAVHTGADNQQTLLGIDHASFEGHTGNGYVPVERIPLKYHGKCWFVDPSLYTVVKQAASDSPDINPWNV